ncbi:HVO_0234 family beta-propeller protein [Halorubrum sp. DTA98]|uniref:HVO_0234 family beta-propeller protein n=1 Tax=Halorubrum sp. DTA98 TaxID=3402163 RepID=UPI003AAF3289
MAPADDDISIEEKRVYAARAGRTDVYLATRTGVVRVAVSGDKIGTFSLVDRESACDVAVLGRASAADVLAVATERGLRLATLDDADRDHEFVAVEDIVDSDAGDADASGDAPDAAPGAAVAVGAHDGAVLAASADGTITRLRLEGGTGEERLAAAADRVGRVDEPRAIDGPLIAGSGGVHRVVDAADGPRIEAVGLDDVRDVAGTGVPLAATSDGLYWLGNGWMDALAGSFDAVAADGNGHAMAVTEGALFVHAGDDDTGTDWSTDAWASSTLPVDERPVALGYGPGISAVVTVDGTLCVDVGDGWRHQTIGVPDVGGIALAAVDEDGARSR